MFNKLMFFLPLIAAGLLFDGSVAATSSSYHNKLRRSDGDNDRQLVSDEDFDSSSHDNSHDVASASSSDDAGAAAMESSHDGSSHDVASSSTSVSDECNGNGNKYVISEQQVLGFYDLEPQCECFDCFSGDSCEIKDDIMECHIEADSVELDIVKSVLPFETISYSDQFRIDYQSFKGIGNDTDFTYTVSETIKDLHRAAGNVNFEDHELIVGLGAHQLVQAALFALSPDRSITTSVFTAPPYWSKFKRMIDSYSPANKHFDNYEEAMDVVNRGDAIVDLITSPSNSGNMLASEQQLLGLPSTKQIWDLVYYWPSSYADKSKIVPLEEDIMIFSLSKLAGFSGHRFGWVWVKDPEVAERMKNYLSITTQSYPAAELVYGTRVIQMILESLGTEDDFFKGIQNELMGRCKTMRSMFKDQGDKFKIKSPCGNMYILVKCMDVDAADSCKEKYFDPIKLDVTGGEEMGIEDNYIRIAFGYDQPHFDRILEKLELLPQGGE